MGQDGNKVWTYKRDGTLVEWSGLEVSYCTKCEELFASTGAFNHHLKRTGQPNTETIHDFSGMPRNAKGHLVTSLRTQEETDRMHGGE